MRANSLRNSITAIALQLQLEIGSYEFVQNFCVRGDFDVSRFV